MKKFDVLGVNVAAVQIKDVLGMMQKWIADGKSTHYICVTNINNVMFSVKNQDYRLILNFSDLAVPDGMSLVWIGKVLGFPLRERVCGPDLMLAFCSLAEKKGYSNYFYGGAPGVPEKMVSNLKRKFPNLRVAGTHSPPFRSVRGKEDTQVIEMINRACPDVLWIGLGCPKQEYWMIQHKDVIKVPVMVGVGAAFDFFSGRLNRAPGWMQKSGLEWAFRLFQEPGRLWYRYLIYNPLFVINFALQQLGLIKFQK